MSLFCALSIITPRQMFLLYTLYYPVFSSYLVLLIFIVLFQLFLILIRIVIIIPFYPLRYPSISKFHQIQCLFFLSSIHIKVHNQLHFIRTQHFDYHFMELLRISSHDIFVFLSNTSLVKSIFVISYDHFISVTLPNTYL